MATGFAVTGRSLTGGTLDMRLPTDVQGPKLVGGRIHTRGFCKRRPVWAPYHAGDAGGRETRKDHQGNVDRREERPGANHAGLQRPDEGGPAKSVEEGGRSRGAKQKRGACCRLANGRHHPRSSLRFFLAVTCPEKAVSERHIYRRRFLPSILTGTAEALTDTRVFLRRKKHH